MSIPAARLPHNAGYDAHDAALVCRYRRAASALQRGERALQRALEAPALLAAQLAAPNTAPPTPDRDDDGDDGGDDGDGDDEEAHALDAVVRRCEEEKGEEW
eukprot:gene54411-17307_t